MYGLDITPQADKILTKLSKKNPKQAEIVIKKIREIREIRVNPYGYKFLRKPLHGFNRVHIDKHFVLVFKINHKKEIIEVYFYDHHDSIYDWRPKNNP